jgi:DNA-binding transcriptional ArsR family regulator
MLTAVSDHLTSTFAALADPTRRAILARLSSGAASVTELAEPFEMSLPAISKHLKVLERAHLIARGREAQWRPCRLEATPLKEVADWVEHYRQFWTESFDRLDAYLRTVQGEAKAVAKGAHAKSRVNANKPARARKKAVKESQEERK